MSAWRKMEVSKSKMAACIVCHVVANLLFLHGFFPYKVTIDEYNGETAIDQTIPSDSMRFPPDVFNATREIYSPLVGRTVLLVIDALRTDFVFGKSRDVLNDMPYLQDQLRNTNRTMKFIAKVHSPTVTLPRIKALTSGTIPGFIDVLLNFKTSAFLEDNFIEQAYKGGRNVVFYGDDTWMKLFPRQFVRSEGTTSFFVTDFHEVDDNVTRHLESELKRDDWSVLVLHYLGLDHIGHVFGPQSELIVPKLQEMDNVIQRLDVALQASTGPVKPSLLVICGDHGMSDGGGHGGSSHAETEVPVIFVSSAFEGSDGDRSIQRVFQMDVAPTLSVLLGLPIPNNNVGRVMPSLLAGLNWKRRLLLLRTAALQLRAVARQRSTSSAIDGCHGAFRAANRDHAAWIQSLEVVGDPTRVEALYTKASICYSDSASAHLVEYGDVTMLLAIVLHWSTFLYLIRTIIVPDRLSLECCFLVGGCVLHAASLAATSFIEEEHQSWYFLTTSFLLLSAFTAQRKGSEDVATTFSQRLVACSTGMAMLACAIVFRVGRSWNTTGDKWSHLKAIGDFFNLPENRGWLTGLAIAALLIILNLRAEHHKRSITALLFVSFTVTYLFHVTNGTLSSGSELEPSKSLALWLARLNYCLILVMLGISVVLHRNSRERIETAVTSWIAVSVLLLRPHNIALFAIWTATNKLLLLRYRDAESPALVYVWLSQAAFFQQGNSNSFARIDLTSGYVGLGSYDPMLVGTLLVISTYAGTVFWMLSLLASRSEAMRSRSESQPPGCLLALLACRSLVWCFYTVIAYTMRYHLFVWTVFAPKLLFEEKKQPR